ncbi:hypothetical protein [Colwellia sp. TT2012]|uniref:hypothetical protein n=1 Tax=Colwellia sp. TT2012 TaxID=1720342 RepID=UPI000708DB6D|nr:hypothetical protein [Colwellia sp. TT2012]
MGYTRKRHYDQYSLAYKLHAVLLASQPGVLAKDVASSLGSKATKAELNARTGIAVSNTY